MPQNSKESFDKLKEEICQFYLNHKTKCDIHYNNAESKDIGKIYENVTDDITIQNLFSRVAIVVLTANKYEKNVLHHYIFHSQKTKLKKIEIELFPQKISKEETYAYWFEWHDYVVLHIEAQKTGSYTMGGSADIVRYVVENKYIIPMAFISFGICFGTNEGKYSIGDVIISKKIYPYFIGAKINDRGYFVSDDNMFTVNSKLSAKIKSAIDQNVFKALNNDVFFDNYITGEAVVSNKRARDEFVKITKQEIIAGEMEGYGLFKECNGSSFSIPCLIIKSICDWAVIKNFDTKNIFAKLSIENKNVTMQEQVSLKDRLQAYAAFQAYSVLNILLSKHIFENSIYKQIIDYIKNVRGRVVLGNSIAKETQLAVKKCIKTQMDCDDFVNSIIMNLINDKVITGEDCDFSMKACDIKDEMSKHSYLINK